MPIASQKKTIFVIILALTVLLSPSSAFSQEQRRETDRTRVMSYSASVKPTAGALLSGDYRLGPGDVLQIEVWREPELTREVRVRPDGKINYPLLGTINVADLTIDEVHDTLKTEFEKFVKYPEVSVVVKETAGNIVIILGEVIYPGIYTYKGGGDVLTAIGLAGDFTGSAKRESVIVISDNFTDKPKVRRVNVFKSFYHGAGANFLLKNGDVIYVPRNWIADWNKTINDLQPTIHTLMGQNFGTDWLNARLMARNMYYNRDKPITKETD